LLLFCYNIKIDGDFIYVEVYINLLRPRDKRSDSLLFFYLIFLDNAWKHARFLIKKYIFYDKNLLENSAAMATLVVTDSMVFAEQ